MIKFDHKKLAKATNIHFVAQVKQYLRDAKDCITEEFKSEQDPQLSFSFSGTQNTSRAGTPVPIVYGEIVTGSVVISGAIDTQQVQA